MKSGVSDSKNMNQQENGENYYIKVIFIIFIYGSLNDAASRSD